MFIFHLMSSCSPIENVDCCIESILNRVKTELELSVKVSNHSCELLCTCKDGGTGWAGRASARQIFRRILSIIHFIY